MDSRVTLDEQRKRCCGLLPLDLLLQVCNGRENMTGRVHHLQYQNRLRRIETGYITFFFCFHILRQSPARLILSMNWRCTSMNSVVVHFYFILSQSGTERNDHRQKINLLQSPPLPPPPPPTHTHIYNPLVSPSLFALPGSPALTRGHRPHQSPPAYALTPPPPPPALR